MVFRRSKFLITDLSIPGTTVLVGDKSEIKSLGLDNKPDSSIILLPQPSSDPNDPLNWKYHRKCVHFIILFFFSLILAACSNFTGPIYLLLAEIYGKSLNDLNDGSALSFLFLAISCLFLQPIAAKFGRRPVYLGATVLVIFSFVAFVVPKSYGGYMAMNILSGLAVGPIDSLIEVSIADIFFLHEHGKYIGIYSLTLGLGSAFGPFIAGYATSNLGYLWCGYLSIIICGALLLVQFFFLEESYYDRKVESKEVEDRLISIALSNTSQSPTVDVGDIYELPTEKGNIITEVSSVNDNHLVDACPIKAKTYIQRLQPFIVTDRDFSFYSIFRTLQVLRYPAVIWAALVYGMQICWMALITGTESQFFMAPPYLFGTSAVGLLSLAMVAGTIIGGIYASFSDVVQIYYTKRNNGIFEPEFRLLLLPLPVILNIGGIFMYGLGPLYGANWSVGAVGIGGISIGLCSVSALALNYVLECYPRQASETITAVLFVRNLFGMVFTFVFQYWLEGVGTLGTTIMLGCLCFAINGLSFFMFTRGKNFRKHTQKWYENSTNT